jgi:hypothetical protein
VAASAGVCVGAGPVRIWSGLPATPEVFVAAAAGAIGGLVALATLSPSAFRELRKEVGRLRVRGRAGVSPRGSSGPPEAAEDLIDGAMSEQYERS